MELKEKAKEVDIISHIGQYVDLKKAGKSYKGLCPFHDEKTPSFHVFPDGRYYCFGCQAKGDIIEFEIQYNKRSFHEALEVITGEKSFFKKDTPVIPMNERKILEKFKDSALLEEVLKSYGDRWMDWVNSVDPNDYFGDKSLVSSKGMNKVLIELRELKYDVMNMIK